MCVECDGRETRVVLHNGVFSDSKLEVEHIEELALDAANIPFSKDTRAECPMDVL